MAPLRDVCLEFPQDSTHDYPFTDFSNATDTESLKAAFSKSLQDFQDKTTRFSANSAQAWIMACDTASTRLGIDTIPGVEDELKDWVNKLDPNQKKMLNSAQIQAAPRK